MTDASSVSPPQAGLGLPFSREAAAADLERLAEDLIQRLGLTAGARILGGNGASCLAMERHFRLRWWSTGDEPLRAALHRAKNRVYQHAKSSGAWQTLTQAWEAAEREMCSEAWRRHLRGLIHETSPAEAVYLRLAFRAAQQAASRAARWRSVLADVPSPFDPQVALFARGAWPVGCRDGELWVLVWSPRAADRPDAGTGADPAVAPGSDPREEDRQIFLSAPFRERVLSEAWRRVLEDQGWSVIHGPVGEERQAPEVQLARRIQESSAVLGLLDEPDPDFGLPWWMFQELDYACACGRPVVLVGRGHLADPELPQVHRIEAPLTDPATVLEKNPVETWLRGSRAKLAGALLLSVWVAISWSPPPAAAQPGGTAVSGAASQAPSPPDAEKAKLERDKLTAERDKLRAERDKLNEEIQQLRDTNAMIGRGTRWATTWAAAIGSFFGALVTLLIGLVGFHLNQIQRDKLQQDKDLEQKKHELETRKLEQERAQERSKHLLEIFRDLGSEQARIRMGAVSILVQKVQKIRSGGAIDPDDKQDLPTIVSTLIIATKYEEKAEIQKQIADGLAQALDAIVPENEAPLTPKSPFESYDFQGARLENAWWRRVDARKVDFYKACLVRAGMRQAFLSGAVLKKADLHNATLVDAQLDGADLTDADLRGANLRGANLDQAILRGAKLDGAILYGVDLTKVKDLTNVDLRAVKTDASTVLPAIPPPPSPTP